MDSDKRLILIKTTLLVVFLGWLMIWIMVPTKTYKNNWTPRLTKNLSSTYFEVQGINLLLFTFPVMFIATLGCIYLHFRSKSDKPFARSSGKWRRQQWWGRWRRPVLVMAPIGIVTATEVVFGLMFAALMIWSLANYLYVSFGHLHKDGVGETQGQLKFRSVSLRLGYIGNICWAFLFFPVTRSSSILPLLGLTSESSIKYHIWLGHISNVLFTLHTLGFIIYWGLTHQMSLILEWSSTYVSNLAGTIAMVIAFVMWGPSLGPIRRKMFELFFYTHQLYGLYILFYALHVGAAWFCMIIPGIFLFVIDRFLRFLQSRQRVAVLSARILPSGFVELNFAKTHDLKYNPTSIMFVNIPSISKMQWHPFTVISSSNLEPETLSVAIKCQGTWTQKLYQTLSSSSSSLPSSTERLEVSIEGPYGPTSSHFLRHQTLVMISGGSGITPFISIIREMIHQSNEPNNNQIPRIILVCAFKTTSELAVLDLLLPISSPPSTLISKTHLQIQAYITQDTEPDPEANKHDSKNLITSLCLHPSPTLDSPITPTLGSDSWLWLGSIIASSFVMFLILLGLVTRYYIYPIEHPGSMDMDMGMGMGMAMNYYHYSYWLLWDIFLICGSVFVVSSVVFLWKKKEIGSKDARKQIKIVDHVPTPTASPGSWFHGGSQESIPHNSLVQATTVRYGARPDLKRILLDCKEEEDVGVFVCGPRSMRHDVAKICSSGLAENLHFESISFDF